MLKTCIIDCCNIFLIKFYIKILENKIFLIPFSVKNRFGNSDEGRLRVHQTADVVVVMLNNPMGAPSATCPTCVNLGICFSPLFSPEKPYAFPAIALHAHYGKF